MTTLLNEGSDSDFSGLVTNPHVTSQTAHGGIEQRDVRVIEIQKDSPHRIIGKDLRPLSVS